MSNFSFLQTEWTSLYEKARKAESRVFSEPTSSLSYSRLALEEAVYQVYDLHLLELPYNRSLFSLLSERSFTKRVPPELLTGLNLVRKLGNEGAHFGKQPTAEKAERCLKYLFPFLKWFAAKYSTDEPELPGAFDGSLLPSQGNERRLTAQLEEAQRQLAALRTQQAKLEAERVAAEERAKASEAAAASYTAQLETQKAAVEQRIAERRPRVATEYTEAETRRHLIDADLAEAGWTELRNGYELEYPVTGMPISKDNPKGYGYVDYVLWDDDGSPLALIEAKRTKKSPEVGRHQAKLYADCLEAEFGRRPLIFYTNGYTTMLWDDVFYSAPRQVFGFYDKEKLRWHLRQRVLRADLREYSPKANIAGRAYQQEAIRRVAEAFLASGADPLRGNRRAALLVMATGSGKTRTAAALVDLLFRHGWVKRVLFLADRNALVTQAKTSFGEHLPELTAIDLTQEQEDANTRLVFSTYPTMMNKIDGMRAEGKRLYGIGHFDLIIVDEAHRSVYNRYKALFDYFDSLVVALTATPKSAIDHNTYELFGCADDDPTFEYTLEEAVPVYLKAYQNINVSTQFLREGIKYAELSEREKTRYEEEFRDETTGLFPEEIEASAMNKWLFNKDTVNKVLDELMARGLKIEGGDKLGRTIIFAVNKSHAEFITDCFLKRFPELPADFIATIHNGVSHAQSLIKAFCDKHVERMPQIAVSVDMMDTGIDAPRVLNLVFFKVVRSYAKFWQMIGRGTRLCPDVFGPGRPKEHFLIFDVCQNFEFFEVEEKGHEGHAQLSLTQQIFAARLQLSQLLLQTGEEDDAKLAKQLLDGLHAQVAELKSPEQAARFQVAMQLEDIDTFFQRRRWDQLSNDDLRRLKVNLSGLLVPEEVHESARRFDLLMLKLQLSKLTELAKQEIKLKDRLLNIGQQLSRKLSIPEVMERAALITAMQDPGFADGLRQLELEWVRKEIRELLQYLNHEQQSLAYTDFLDQVEIEEGVSLLSTGGSSLYQQRVEAYLRENRHHIVIRKIATNQPITSQELAELEQLLFDGDQRGTRADFEREYGDQPLASFIRSILGLEESVARAAFAEFVRTGPLSANQMKFVDSIVSYLSHNGSMDPAMLFESPFNELHDQGVIGLFDEAQSKRIIRIIRQVSGEVG